MIGLVLAVALAGQAGPAPVLPGVLDLPLLNGGRIVPDCLGMKERLDESGETYVCVGAPVAGVNTMAQAYVEAAGEHGWVDAGGAANALWMSRTLDDGRCQRLTVAGMWDFSRRAEPRPNDPGYVLLSVDLDARCPAPRPAR